MMKKYLLKIQQLLNTEIKIPFVNFDQSKKILKANKGSALMIAIFSVSFMIIIATQVMYVTSVEFVLSSKSVDQVKAYYAAKAGLEMSLLRIQMFRKAKAMIGDSLPDKTILDQIWQFPFAWPPIVPMGTDKMAKTGIDKIVKTSGMQGKYIAVISSEGSKIDVNDLGSQSKVVAQSVHNQLLQLFQSKIKSDEAFSAEYSSYDFDKLINNIADWVSEGPTSNFDGGDKKTRYSQFSNEFIPPNQAFKTINEIHMVKDMKDDFFNILFPNITVFGSKAINVNLATQEVLMSLSPQITLERAGEILKLRASPTRGPFKDYKDFLGALSSLGVTGDPFTDPQTKEMIPLSFDSEFNFRIKSTGISGKVQRTIEAVVYDYDRVKANLTQQMQQQKQAGSTPTPTPTPNPGVPPGGGTPTPSPSPSPTAAKIDVPNERPSVIYWEEN